MADISAEISAFQNAVYGEDVRTAMVNLANKINNESSSADTTVAGYDTRLSAIEADGYVTTAKLADGAVTDEKLAQSGGVLDEVDKLNSVISASVANLVNTNEYVHSFKSITYSRDSNPITIISGAIKPNGSIISLGSYSHTEQFDVIQGTVITYKKCGVFGSYPVVAAYDANGNFLPEESSYAETTGLQTGTYTVGLKTAKVSIALIQSSGDNYAYEITTQAYDDRLGDMDDLISGNKDLILDIRKTAFFTREITHTLNINPLEYASGAISASGRYVGLDNVYHTELLPVEPGSSISYVNVYGYSGYPIIATYNIDETFNAAKCLLSEGTTRYSGTWTIPDDIYYIAISFYGTNPSGDSAYQLTAPKVIPANEAMQSVAGPWSGKTAVIIGDSITAGLYTPTGESSPNTVANPKYWNTASNALGISTIVGYGDSGTSISRTSTTNSSRAMSIRYAQMIDGADLVIVAGGTNDYGTNVVLGSIADTEDVSFYGALNVLCDGLQTKYPGKRMVFITPLHRQNEGTNTAGYTLAQYRQAIYDVARDKYGYAVIDGWELGISCANSSFKSTYIYDGLHPTQLGHNLLGINLAHKLASI